MRLNSAFGSVQLFLDFIQFGVRRDFDITLDLLSHKAKHGHICLLITTFTVYKQENPAPCMTQWSYSKCDSHNPKNMNF